MKRVEIAKPFNMGDGRGQPVLEERLTLPDQVVIKAVQEGKCLVRIPGRQVFRDFGAFLQIPANGDPPSRRAGPVGLLETVIPPVEGGDHAGAAIAGWRLGIDQGLHFRAPFLAFIGAADTAQVMQRAENFGQPLQFGIERRCGVLRPREAGQDQRENQNEGHKTSHHDGVIALPARGTQGAVFFFDAFSSREPASTSLENAIGHDPEKWKPVFGQDHAQLKEKRLVGISADVAGQPFIR